MTYPQGWQSAELIRLLYRLDVLDDQILHNAIDQIQIAIWRAENEE